MRTELADWAKGKVWGYWVNPKTGHTTRPFKMHNIITYAGADIMANVLGGNTLYIPKHVGFIYGTKAAPGIPDPITSRVQNWTDLGTELAPVAKANVLITSLASQPLIAEEAGSLPSGTYAGNSATFSAHTGTRLEYGFTAGATYASPLADTNYVYHCMLLTRLVSGSTITYLPFARVSLVDGVTYPQKPVGMELCVFWSIVFS